MADPVAPVVVDSPIPSVPNSSPPADPAVESVPGVTPVSKIDPGFQEINGFLGIDSSQFVDDAAAGAALRPALEILAQTGAAQTAPPVNAPIQPAGVDPVPVAPDQPLPPAVGDFSFEGIDFGEAGPEVEKAFKALGKQNQKALSHVLAEAQAAKKSADETRQAYLTQSSQAVQVQEQQVLQRANSYLDGLASPKYGVGQNQSMVQQLASQQVLQVAGNLYRGMQTQGRSPNIETLMQAAVFFIEGKMPTATPAAPAPVPGLPPRTASGEAPAPVRGSGSAGEGGALMDDTDFLAGARAILSS